MYPEPTELFLTGCLNQSGFQNSNQVCRHQLADILKKGNFTRDEWNNLLHLFNISHFSSLCWAENFSLISCTKTMATEMQEQKEDNRIVAKSKPTAMNLAVSVSTSSSTVTSPIASKSQEILNAPCRTDWMFRKPYANANQSSNPDAASSSQGLQRGVKDQDYLNYPENFCTETCSLRTQRVSIKPRNTSKFRRLRNRRQ